MQVLSSEAAATSPVFKVPSAAASSSSIAVAPKKSSFGSVNSSAFT
jgi:hypothetical protein